MVISIVASARTTSGTRASTTTTIAAMRGVSLHAANTPGMSSHRMYFPSLMQIPQFQRSNERMNDKIISKYHMMSTGMEYRR